MLYFKLMSRISLKLFQIMNHTYMKWLYFKLNLLIVEISSWRPTFPNGIPIVIQCSQRRYMFP